MAGLTSYLGRNKFNIVSWLVTVLIAAGLITGALIWRNSNSNVQALAPLPTSAPQEEPAEVEMPALGGPDAVASIERDIQLKTHIPADKPRYDITEYRVTRGDSIFAISDSYKLKPETVLWAN